MKEQKKLKFVYLTEEDVKLKISKQIYKLTEEQKSEFIYNNQPLYKLGTGHDFCYGFFTEYLTKTGINARCYINNIWHINGEVYNYINSEFIKIPKIKRNLNPINFKNISFPLMKNSKTKTLAEDLISVKPIK